MDGYYLMWWCWTRDRTGYLATRSNDPVTPL
jgi:hypothetical protein